MTSSTQIARIGGLLSLIEAKYIARGQAHTFQETQRVFFGEILEHLPPALAAGAVRRLLLFSRSFLPDQSELLLVAAQLASPLPDEDTAWREVFDRMGAVRPRPLSHPQIRETVRDLGGYETLWHQYQYAHTPFGVLRSQFLEAYKRRRDRWETAVRETLLRPRDQWDWSLLPPGNPLLEDGASAQESPMLSSG